MESDKKSTQFQLTEITLELEGVGARVKRDLYKLKEIMYELENFRSRIKSDLMRLREIIEKLKSFNVCNHDHIGKKQEMNKIESITHTKENSSKPSPILNEYLKKTGIIDLYDKTSILSAKD